jgi:hypothetical protein
MRLLFCLLLVSQGIYAQIQIQVTLSGTPSSVTIEKKKLKYGKQGAFCFIYDDRPLSALDGYNIMPYHTDGTGKQIRYTATIASNGVTYTGQDFSANGAMTLQQLKFLVDNNWALACHGYYHGIPQQQANAGFTVVDNVEYNRQYHYNQLKNLGSEYVLRTGVVPSADTGYHRVWPQFGYLAGTSQNQFDNNPANPGADWVNGGIADVNNLGNGYQIFARRFNDIVDQPRTDHLISSLNNLFNQASPTNAALLIYGTHETQNNFFSQALNHVVNNGGDRIWVTSFQEFMEYNEVKHRTNISYSINGNIVTITLNQQLPDATRWRDLSLQLASNQNIVNVTATGADSVSFNASTGLINVFKKKISGFNLGASSPLPVRFTGFTGSLSQGSIQLQWNVADAGSVSVYEIEKSDNGANFRRIGSTQSTSFIDNDVKNTQYYRIKAIENGTPVYSTTIKITNKKQKASINYKRGMGASIQLDADRHEKTKISVYNATGQLVFEKPVMLIKGINQIQVPDPVSSGVFYVRIGNERLSFIK